MQTNSTEDSTMVSQEQYLCRTYRKYDRIVNFSTIAATENRTTKTRLMGNMRSIFVGLAVCPYMGHTQTALATTPIEMSQDIGGINRGSTNFEVGAGQ